MDNVIVRIINMECGIRAVTCEDCNGDYNIYINDDLDDTEKLRAYIHEMRHIVGNHFDDKISALLAEKEVEK